MPRRRPLPRSLALLPGESLPGFLLRLSCRLGQPPARIAELTGLAPDGRSGAMLPVTLLAGIPEPAMRTFTFMTRLDAGQAAQLGMSAWRERYAPVVISGPDHAGAGYRRLNGELVLAPVTRYCPDCLAGDGSAIQESFGGPWLKTWHLPIIFACTAHQRLLEHLCPDCGRPVRGRRPGTQFSLLPAMRAAALHPAQCRAELTPAKGRHTLPGCCGARLDQTGSRRPATPGLAALQDKVLGLLDPGGPASALSAGQPTRPSGYFADILAIGLLACSTWPAARHLSPSEDIAAAVDEHVASLRRRTADRQEQALASSTSRTRFGSLPADAAASAGLAHIADHVLAGSTGDVREKLRQFLPASSREVKRTVWARRVTWSSPPCSDGLREAFGPLQRGFTKAAGSPRGRRNAVLGPRRWGPENIPAFLPEDWHARYFTPIDGVNPMFTRRTAVLRLVQMVAGGSLGEAAAFLGIATTLAAFQGRIYSGAGHVHSGARQQLDPLGFETALTALTRELDDPATPLVNYQHRRRALENWSIDEDTWTALTGRLPPVPGPQQPELGDRKRQIASAYVWTQVTSGEHYFAPRPVEAAQPPEIQKAWKERRNTIWHLMHRSQPGPHYTSLKAELGTIATSLARSIDTYRMTAVAAGRETRYRFAYPRSGTPIGVPAIADHEPPPAWQSGRYQPDADAWRQLRPQLRLGQQLAGTVAWMIRPGVTGIGIDLGLPVGGFVDVVHLSRDPGRWPALGTVTTFIIWWIDERPQIRLVPADPRYRREDFGTWIQQQATPAAAAFRERQPTGPGGTEASLEHPWLGTVRRHGHGQLIAHIDIPPAIRTARNNGDTDAEVLIEEAGAAADLPALADDAATRVQAALAALDEIKDYAAEHAPSLLADNRLPVPASLRDALFLEGFTISGTGTEIAFDYGALDMIVVQADPGGQCHSVVLCP